MSTRNQKLINAGGLAAGLIIAVVIVAAAWAFNSAPSAAAEAHDHAAHAEEGHEDASEAEARDPDRPWCAEHNTYEDICPICRGEAVPQGAVEARDPGRAWCAEHQVYEDACAICKSASLASLKPGQGMLIRLASSETFDKASIETARPGSGVSADADGYVCRAMYDENRFAHIVPSVDGIVMEVHVGLGQAVAAGDPIITLSSPDVASAQAAYAEALAVQALAADEFAREKTLHEREISAARDFQAAQTALTTAQLRVDAAKQQLSLLGLRRGGDSGAHDGTLVLHAPFAGTIVDRHAVIGETVERGAALASVADLKKMWVEVSVPPALSGAVSLGANVQARFSDLNGLVLEGAVDWIAPQIDADSRTLRVRAIVPNPGGVLKHNMFGRASFQGIASAGAMLVPSDAVQYHEGNPLVFLRQEDDLIEVRGVALGARNGDHLEIRDGLEADDELVVARAYTLKSEMLKGRLGAGCTDH